MSQENVESARRAFDAFNRRDKTAWLAEVDPEFETFPSREWPENAPIRGAEASWDKVVASSHREMRDKTSGGDIVWDFWVVITFRGRAFRFEWFADRAEALEAAGLQE